MAQIRKNVGGIKEMKLHEILAKVSGETEVEIHYNTGKEPEPIYIGQLIFMPTEEKMTYKYTNVELIYTMKNGTLVIITNGGRKCQYDK